MAAYQPPFKLTHRMTVLVADIAEQLGAWKAAKRGALVPEVRRGNRIRSLQASLAIEQNTLSVEQVTAVLADKPVLGSPKEIQEVRNAFAAYEAIERWQPHRLADLLQTYGLLMAGLVDRPGKLRDGDVGIWRGRKFVHMAPPASQLARLVKDLLGWLRKTDAHPLVASAAFHYDTEFIGRGCPSHRPVAVNRGAGGRQAAIRRQAPLPRPEEGRTLGRIVRGLQRMGDKATR